MAVLDQDGLARVVEQLRPERQVELLAAAVELRAVEAIVKRCVDVALVAFERVAVVAADAVVAVCKGEGNNEAREYVKSAMQLLDCGRQCSS